MVLFTVRTSDFLECYCNLAQLIIIPTVCKTNVIIMVFRLFFTLALSSSSHVDVCPCGQVKSS